MNSLCSILTAKDGLTVEATSRLLAHTHSLRIPSLLAAPLLALLDISSASAAAAQAKLDKPSNDRGTGSDPHECKHLGAEVGANVELGDGREDVAEDDEEDGGDDGADGGEEGGEEGEDHDEDGPPAGEDGDELEKYHDE